MDVQILIGLLLTVSPVFELRAGLPVVIEYVVRNNLPVLPYFLLVLALNILVVFLIFMFFDFIHETLMNCKWYRRVIGRVLARTQKKVDKVKVRMNKWGYFALMLFVAIPVPGSGAWTGTLVAWIMGLDRLRSFAAIAVGVVIAGLIVLLFSLGFFNGVY